MSSVRTRVFPWVAPLLLATLAGCSDSGPTIVKVSGTLTYKGQPVTNAYIQFLPEQGRQSWAQTDEQGRFKINYDRHQDGAVVGKHKVWLERRPTSAAESEAAMLGKRLPGSKEMAGLFEK